jgi:hypothetical protein
MIAPTLLAAAGYNFRRLLAWLTLLLSVILIAIRDLRPSIFARSSLDRRSKFFTSD